jgi:hypothetical protein
MNLRMFEIVELDIAHLLPKISRTYALRAVSYVFRAILRGLSPRKIAQMRKFSLAETFFLEAIFLFLLRL